MSYDMRYAQMQMKKCKKHIGPVPGAHVSHFLFENVHSQYTTQATGHPSQFVNVCIRPLNITSYCKAG